MTVETAAIRTGSRRAVTLGVVERRQHDGRAAVGRRADLQQSQRVGHHRRGDDLVDGVLLAVARVGVVETVPGVLHLDLREVLFGRTAQLHPSTRVQGEVRRVRSAEETEAAPVRIVGVVGPRRREESLRRGVGTDDEGDVAQPGEDPCCARCRWPSLPRRTPRSTSRRGRPSSPGPARTSRRRRSRRSRCGSSRRRR